MRAKLEDASTSDLASLNWYVVKSGDTLALVARKLKVSRTDLAEANYLKATSRVTPGQKLMVPREASPLIAARADVVVPADTRPIVKDAVVAAIEMPAVSRVKVSYQVKPGDTLASIARVYGTSVASIQSWNQLSDTLIRAGERITIYTSRAN